MMRLLASDNATGKRKRSKTRTEQFVCVNDRRLDLDSERRYVARRGRGRSSAGDVLDTCGRWW